MSVREATKLWHDDVRPAPKGWLWAQNNMQAKHILEVFDVVECSLDHDLGADPSEGLLAKGSGEETGLQLVDWMIENDCVPEVVTIHSWNPPAARRMERAFIAAGHRSVRVRPYQMPLPDPPKYKYEKPEIIGTIERANYEEALRDPRVQETLARAHAAWDREEYGPAPIYAFRLVAEGGRWVVYTAAPPNEGLEITFQFGPIKAVSDGY
jgi:hypothetical protein